ncbi:Phospho-N-acetylmuramoyl-pentapeptide-transferase [Gordonia sp. YY1]|nr:Phospho-N-acetylmuramoyl-pentapeptide-transferase [Gordonia sp. YY1]
MPAENIEQSRREERGPERTSEHEGNTVTQILLAGAIAIAVSILLTPVLIKVFSRQGFGQEIRVEGPQSHQTKRGTPSMGGVAILAALWAGYFGSHLVGLFTDAGNGPTASGLLVLGLATALGIVGFLDDIIKIRKHRNLGLNKTAKSIGQFIAAILFGILVLQFRNDYGLTPASTHLSYVRDINAIGLGSVVFVIFCWLVVAAWSNAVNFTDGLDGLAAGSMAMVLGSYVLVTFFQFVNACAGGAKPPSDIPTGCYQVRDPLDLAIIAVAGGGACLGFLWWNAAPAKIFMGDTGSLALGGMLAGLSITTRTELLAVVIGALFVAEIMSVVIQIAFFRTTGRRVFRMAPFHHHFELGGWAETTVIIRFWLLTAIACALGLSLFYGEFLTTNG